MVITSEGMAAIGVEADDAEAPAATDTAPTPAEADSAADAPAPASEADGAKKRAKGRPAKGEKARTTARPPESRRRPVSRAPKPTPRAGTKQAQMIAMLKRPEGATVEQIAAATGWEHHTIRGAISGALKKKLGLTVEATAPARVGPTRPAPRAASTSTGSSRVPDAAAIHRLTPPRPRARRHLFLRPPSFAKLNNLRP